MWARYLSPCIIVSWNKGGAYIIAKLDSSVFDHLVAAFHIIPYFARQAITLPLLDALIDISQAQLAQMEDSTPTDPEEEDNEDHLVNPKILDND